MKKRLLSINGLALATGRDRATITKRLIDVEPDEIRGKARLYDLDDIVDIIMQDDAPHNPLREMVNGCIGWNLEKPVDAVADALREVLAGHPPELVSKAVAAATVAQCDAWRRMVARDQHFRIALESEFARDVDHLAQRLMKPHFQPKGKTSPRWRQFDLSKSVVEEIEKNSDVPAYITCYAEEG